MFHRKKWTRAPVKACTGSSVSMLYWKHVHVELEVCACLTESVCRNAGRQAYVARLLSIPNVVLFAPVSLC